MSKPVIVFSERSRARAMAKDTGKSEEACRSILRREKALPRAVKAGTYIPAKHRLRAYGITSERYAQMKAEQSDACAICLRERALVIDHSHATGVVRGLLCRECNAGLGLFRDNPDALERASAYLKRNARLAY